MTDDEKEELISVIEVLSSFDKELAYIYGVSTVPKFEKKRLRNETFGIYNSIFKKNRN